MIKGKRGIAFFTAFSLLLTAFVGFTVRADEKKEPQMLTKGDNSIMVMDMLDDYDRLGPVGSQAQVNGLPGYENAPMQVVRYHGDSFETLDTWDEGVIGVSDGGMWTFCTEPMNVFHSGTATVYDAAQFYTQEEITKMALVIKFCQENQSGLSQSQKYYLTQCTLWTLLQRMKYYYDGDVAFECNGFIDGGVMGGLIESALNYANDNADKYKGYGKILWNGTSSQKVAVFKVEAMEGQIEVYKKSNNPELTENNPCYSLTGAEFTVYMPDTNDVVAKIVTDLAGHGIVTVPAGTYDILETKAPKGFALNGNGKRDKIIVNPNATATYEKIDNAQSDPVRILLGKVNAETNSNKPEGSLPLINAEFTIKYYKGFYNTNPASQGTGAERTWILKTNGDGYCEMREGFKVGGDEFYLNSKGVPSVPLGTITLQETKAPEGYLLNGEIFVKQITSKNQDETVDTYNKPTVSEPVIRGGVSVKKLDNETNSGVPQGNASLAGAKIQIVSDNDSPVKVNGAIYQKGQMVALLTTNDKGEAQTAADLLPYGDYILKEQSPPNGYQMAGVIQQRFSIRENGVLVQMTTPDTAIKDNVIRGGVKVQKWDNETNQGKPQGNATLKGAEFELSSLNANPVLVDGVKYEKNQAIATLKTDEQGVIQVPGNYLPYGKYKFRETKPPEGYNHTGTLEREFEIRDNGKIVQLTTSSGVIKNDVIRGDLQLVKIKESWDGEEDQKIPLEGIKFMLTSKTTGQKFVITTDKYGYATTKQLGVSDRGNLVYDTYIVHESNTPHGLKPVKDFEITIKNEGETLYYILEDKLILCPVQLLKADKTTGQRIPLADTEFQLLDKDKEPVIMKTHYPNETVLYTYKTDASGSLMLPEKLPVGVYYWREVNSPAGYLLNGQDVKFEVTEGHNWEEPFTVEFENVPAMGQIEIKKTDKETGKPLAGAVFEVKARKDVVTPDGTVRAKAGEVVDTITTQKNGTAETKKLHLGKYSVQETKPSPGYVLSVKKYNVELKYKNQNVPLVTEQVAVTNIPTKVVVEKVAGDTKKPLAGVRFAVWNKDMSQDVDPDFGKPQEYVTDSKGQIVLEALLPGTYCIQETKSVPGYAMDDTIRELTIDKDGKVDGKSGITIHIENPKTIVSKTTAVSMDTGGSEGITKDQAVIKDIVSLENLQPGETYQVKGLLVDKTTGQPWTANSLPSEKNIVSEKTFQATNKAMDVEMTFQFNAVPFAGKTAVVFEHLYVGKKEVAAHADIKDKGQTVTFPRHMIQTTAIDKATGESQAVPGKETVIVDTVAYDGLIAGQKYTLKGALMDKETGKSLTVDGKPVAAEKTFQAKKSKGEEEVRFAFDSSGLTGKDIVAYEKLYVQGVEVAAHEDIKDKGQTVTFPSHMIQTTAIDKATGTNQAVAGKNTTIVDAVTYDGLIAGQKYTLKGALMDKETGKPLTMDGKPVTAEKTFQAKESKGREKVTFVFDSSGLTGKNIVAYEKLYVQGVEVAAHEDIKDKGQTVAFPRHMIQTKAKDKFTGKGQAVAGKDMAIVDTVAYEGLIPGQEYTLKGVLMDKETGKPLTVDGKPVAAEKTFKPEKNKGEEEVVFAFDASGMKEKTVVAYEKLYVQGIEVAAHEDINDGNQTVDLIENIVKTGDDSNIFGMAGDLCLLSAVVIYFVIYKRKGKRK